MIVPRVREVLWEFLTVVTRMAYWDPALATGSTRADCTAQQLELLGDSMNYPPQQRPPAGPPPGYPPPGWQYPAAYSQPPPKRRAGLVVAIVAVVMLVVGALAITGFVAPGFFLSDDNEQAVDDPTPVDQAQLEQAGGDPQALAEATVAALLAKDAAAVDRVLCPDATEDARGVKQILPMVQDVRLDGDVRVKSDTEASARITITANGTTATLTQELRNSGGKWCWHGVTADAADLPEPSPEEKASLAAARKIGQQFLSALQSGRKARAVKTFCEKPPRFVVGMIEEAIKAGAKLRISEIPSGGGQLIAVLVDGKIGRNPASGTVMTEGDERGGARCVSSFLFK